MKKMKKLFLTVVTITSILLFGCNSHEPTVEPDLSEQPVIDDAIITVRQTRRDFNVAHGEHGYHAVYWLEQINDYLPNRLAFTDRELETAEWLVATILAMGFAESQVEIQTFRYDTPTSSWWGSPTQMIDMYYSMGYYDGLEFIYYSQNVILTIPGQSAQTIIIGAHYDGVGNPGVSDNASGTVLLLENIYRMRNVDHYYTLQYVFFGAEEVGLVGSFYFVDNLTDAEIDNLVLMVNADVIMDGPNLVYAIGYMQQLPFSPMTIMWDPPPIHQNELSEQVKAIANQLNDQVALDLISRPRDIIVATDQLAFLQFARPVLVFFGMHIDGVHLYGDVLHTPDDNLEFIMAEHPNRIERALREFGIFLEEVLSFGPLK